MKRKIEKLITALLIFSVLPFLAAGASDDTTVEWQVLQTLELDAEPLDLAVSQSARWIYVLTRKGKLAVYGLDGKLVDTLDVGTQIHRIKSGPSDDILFLENPSEHTLQVVHLIFVHAIETQGAPFKGMAEAPVEIAVFSDFQ